MENARLLEIQLERVRERSMAGSICKGRVLRVLPGMQAAFVDIGLEQAALLPGADFFPLNADEYPLDDPSFEASEANPTPVPSDDGAAQPPLPPKRTRSMPPIEERLEKGQDIIVQIGKEPLGSK